MGHSAQKAPPPCFSKQSVVARRWGERPREPLSTATVRGDARPTAPHFSRSRVDALALLL